MAHPASGGILEPTQRQYKMNNILRIVSELQQLLYTNLATAVSPECSKYLQYVKDDIKNIFLFANFQFPCVSHCTFRSIRYIDELQKFIEDDQWKRSLALEPAEDTSSNSNSTNSTTASSAATISKDSVRDPNVVPALNLSPSKGMYNHGIL